MKLASVYHFICLLLVPLVLVQSSELTAQERPYPDARSGGN